MASQPPPCKLVLPDSPHLSADTGGRLNAPSAARNFEPIRAVLATYIPARGAVLELASGTGQQIAALAALYPHVTWQPSDVDPERISSIEARLSDAGDNLSPPVHLDATLPIAGGPFDLVFLVNLFHLISKPAARALINNVAGALSMGGHFFLYGPFMRNGAWQSDGDKRFDQSLRAQDPEIGYKDVVWMRDALAGAGLRIASEHDMPANNLSTVAEKIPGQD